MYRVFFDWSYPEKYGTGPPQYRKMAKFVEDSNISTKKSESPSQSLSDLNFSANLQQKVNVCQTLTWTFTFLVGIFAISSELSNFSLLGGTSSILRTFLGGTSQKNHPVYLSNSTKLWKSNLFLFLKNLMKATRVCWNRSFVARIIH